MHGIYYIKKKCMYKIIKASGSLPRGHVNLQVKYFMLGIGRYNSGSGYKYPVRTAKFEGNSLQEALADMVDMLSIGFVEPENLEDDNVSPQEYLDSLYTFDLDTSAQLLEIKDLTSSKVLIN